MVMFKNVVVARGSFMDCYSPFLKYWILLWTRLRACKWAHPAVVSPLMPTWQETGVVRVSVAGLGVSSSVQKAGIDQWQPAKPSRQRSLPRWNQLRRRRGGGSCCGVRDMRVCVCDVSEKEGLFVLGGWHRSCWRFKLSWVTPSLCAPRRSDSVDAPDLQPLASLMINSTQSIITVSPV